MKPAKFAYAAPKTVEEAARIAAGEDGDFKALGGGQSLGPMLNLRLVRPSLLIDLSGIEALRIVDDDGANLYIGAGVTHAMIEDGDVPDPANGMLAHVAAGIAYRAVRTRGTIGGSLAHADPAADWITVFTALDARVSVADRRGHRRVPMTAFMTGAFTTILAGDQIVAGVTIAKLGASGRWGYYKICRKTGEFADAMAAAVFDPERGFARIVMGAMDGAPVLLDSLAAEIARAGGPAGAGAVARAVAEAAPGLDDYRKQVQSVAVRRAIEQVYGA